MGQAAAASAKLRGGVAHRVLRTALLQLVPIGAAAERYSPWCSVLGGSSRQQPGARQQAPLRRLRQVTRPHLPAFRSCQA
eukprot:COSAG01_NODE_294_length_19294_cov_35.559312_20_plen_80_part_00